MLPLWLGAGLGLGLGLGLRWGLCLGMGYCTNFGLGFGFALRVGAALNCVFGLDFCFGSGFAPVHLHLIYFPANANEETIGTIPQPIRQWMIKGDFTATTAPLLRPSTCFANTYFFPNA